MEGQPTGAGNPGAAAHRGHGEGGPVDPDDDSCLGSSRLPPIAVMSRRRGTPGASGLTASVVVGTGGAHPSTVARSEAPRKGRADPSWPPATRERAQGWPTAREGPKRGSPAPKTSSTTPGNRSHRWRRSTGRPGGRRRRRPTARRPGPRRRQHHGRAGGDADGELLRGRRDTGVQPAPAEVVGEVGHQGGRHQAEPGLPGGVVRSEGGDAFGLERVEVGLGGVGLGRPARAEHGGHGAVGQHDRRRAHGRGHGIPEGGVGHRGASAAGVVADEDDRRAPVSAWWTSPCRRGPPW